MSKAKKQSVLGWSGEAAARWKMERDEARKQRDGYRALYFELKKTIAKAIR
jgi:hypothetical protein